jgi:hypothetical protein
MKLYKNLSPHEYILKMEREMTAGVFTVTTGVFTVTTGEGYKQL